MTLVDALGKSFVFFCELISLGPLDRLFLCRKGIRRRLHAFGFAVVVSFVREAGAQRVSSIPLGVLAARLDSIAMQHRSSAPAVGLTVAVVRNGDTLLFRGYGDADRETNRSTGRSTVYRIGSITKQFTAAAVLQLVERSYLTLDDTVGGILPQYKRWGGVTIRQLLNHTSGIPHFSQSPLWLARRTESLPPDTVLSLFADDALRFKPGTQFEYNNSGYLLLGRILEQRTGASLADYFYTRFFQPLGMRSARICADSPELPDEARGYDPAPSGMVPAAAVNVGSFGGAGALCMSVADFLRWQWALTAGRVVSTTMYARMSHSDSTSDGLQTRYGWGLIPQLLAGHPVVRHGGDTYGFSSEQLWLPDDSIRIIVFTNTMNTRGDVTRLAINLARVSLGLSPQVPRPVVSGLRRAAAVGRYALSAPSSGSLILSIWVEGERLMAQVQSPGQQAFELSDRENGAFGSDLVPALRIRVEEENGRGVLIELRQNGVVMRGRRIPDSASRSVGPPPTFRVGHVPATFALIEFTDGGAA